jgi:hypothetical protein
MHYFTFSYVHFTCKKRVHYKCSHGFSPFLEWKTQIIYFLHVGLHTVSTKKLHVLQLLTPPPVLQSVSYEMPSSLHPRQPPQVTLRQQYEQAVHIIGTHQSFASCMKLHFQLSFVFKCNCLILFVFT